MIKAVFFDMNETVLNLGSLKEKFKKSFDSDYALKYWFTKLLHTSTVMGIMGYYKNFGQLAETVLESIYCESGKQLTQKDKDAILGSFRNLAAHADVPKALDILKQNSLRAVVISNSSLVMMREQLTNAGIIKLFDNYYSVDTIEKYKPFSNIYEYAAGEEKLSPNNIMMIAAHDWDLFGAKKAGFKTAYIKRKKEVFNPYYEKPDISADNLTDLVREIIKIG